MMINMDDKIEEQELETEASVSEVITEENNEETVEKRREELVSSLIEPAEQETQEDNTGSVEYKNNREATEASSTKIGNEFARQGIRVGGPGIRKTRAQASTKSEEPSDRLGIFKIWDDQPIRNIGQGTSTSDIPQRKNR